jgi:hypothetical protein
MNRQEGELMDFIRQLPKAEVHIHLEDAIQVLEADRIYHGVRAVEDPDLIGRLLEKQIALGICPTSNLALGLFQTLQEHPIDILLSLAGNSIRFSYAKLERKSQLLSDLAKFGASAGKLQLAQ